VCQRTLYKLRQAIFSPQAGIVDRGKEERENLGLEEPLRQIIFNILERKATSSKAPNA
jgi:hypothetical protein